MIVNNPKVKNFDSSFLYGMGDYKKKIYEYLIKSERVDKTSPAFDDIRYLVKKNQYTSSLSVLLDKPTVILMMPAEPLPRALKVIAARDIKDDGQTKVFIDVSEIVTFTGGSYVIKNKDLDIFISYLVNAMNTLLYYTRPQLLLNNTTMDAAGTSAFAKLVCNIIDYLRIGGVENVRGKVLYMAAMYYQVGILLKPDTDSIYQKAIRIAKISKKEADLIDVQAPLAAYENINTFVAAIAKVIKVDSLRLDIFIDKWIYLYGSGTQFATELYIAFANMLTNAYVGAYLNNQKQIEKFVGRDMADFTNTLFRIGRELM